MAKMTATEKRVDAMQNFLQTVLPNRHDDDGLPYWPSVVLHKPDHMVAMLETLKPLGRTPRWKSAVSGWQAMIRNEKNNAGRRWAIIQGSIYLNFEV